MFLVKNLKYFWTVKLSYVVCKNGKVLSILYRVSGNFLLKNLDFQ